MALLLLEGKNNYFKARNRHVHLLNYSSCKDFSGHLFSFTVSMYFCVLEWLSLSKNCFVFPPLTHIMLKLQAYANVSSLSLLCMAEDLSQAGEPKPGCLCGWHFFCVTANVQIPVLFYLQDGLCMLLGLIIYLFECSYVVFRNRKVSLPAKGYCKRSLMLLHYLRWISWSQIGLN